LAHYKVKSVIHAIAHITGGGLCENLQRVLPEGIHAAVRDGSWPVPPVFGWLGRLGDVDDHEMRRVFNMGLGLVLVVSPYYADSIRSQLADGGLESWIIGEVIEGPRGVDWD
jgi:phosphoribosylformylglycinamidine cyclo-ligase